MSENGNGNAPPFGDQMVALLGQIVTEVQGLRGEVREVKTELAAFKDEVRGELTELRAEIHEIHHEMTDMAADIHEIRDDLRAGLAVQRDHGTRIDRLEQAVFKKTGT